MQIIHVLMQGANTGEKKANSGKSACRSIEITLLNSDFTSVIPFNILTIYCLSSFFARKKNIEVVLCNYSILLLRLYTSNER